MAGFGPFPPDIIQQIVYYLTHGSIGLNGPTENPTLLGTFISWGRIDGAARYSTVDKAWQDAVERETFAELRLDLNRLAEADDTLNGVPRRKKYVRIIRLNVVLPRSDMQKQNDRAL